MEEQNHLFKAKTKYDENLYKKCYTNLSKSSIFILGALSIFPVFFTVYILVMELNKLVLIIPLILFVIIIYRFVKLITGIKKAVMKAVQSRSEYTSEFTFYNDHFTVLSNYNEEVSKISVRYVDINIKKQDKDYVYLSFLNKVAAIDKNSCREYYDMLMSLINIKKDPAKKKNLLTILTILSFTSFFLSMIIISIAIHNSPLPNFPYTMMEYLWIMLLFIPIPITTLVLGIIHKSKRTIISCTIVTIILLIYGTMPFFNIYKISHDYSYVKEIEELTKIDLPDDGYVSIEDAEDYTLSMIKISDDKIEEFLNKLKTSYIWNSNQSFIPVNALDTYSISMTTDYDYFAVYNQTTDKYNTFNGYIVYLAYDIETGIIYIIQYK